MDAKTINHLNSINRAFYATVADEFDQTRGSAWPGWQRLLPYLPMPLGWMKRQLAHSGNVKISGHAIPSVAFDRRVSETSVLGRRLWQGIRWLETRHPDLAAYLGCYVLIVVTKSTPSGGMVT